MNSKRISVLVQWVASAFRFLFRPVPASRSRRDLLQGRFWRLLPRDRYPPLVTRYPKSQDVASTDAASQTRTLKGISIEPVPATDFSKPPDASAIPVFRPPGAIAEKLFLVGCTRCGDCIAACPHDAIRKAPDRLGPVAGTPVIEPDVAACLMCPDFPCITSCEPGVLIDTIPPIMGTARVTEHLCVAYHGTTCSVCSERCPVDGAITVREGKPTINENACTGCGVCRYVCPAPENAILLMPALNRPLP